MLSIIRLLLLVVLIVWIDSSPKDIHSFDFPSVRKATSLSTGRKTAIIRLRCRNDFIGTLSLTDNAFVSVYEIDQYNFRPSLMYFIDVNGKKRSKPHMWVSTNMSYMCSYNMQDMIVSKNGAIFSMKGLIAVDVGHPTVLGGHKPLYTKDTLLLEGYYTAKDTFRIEPKPQKSYDLVVPIRMRYDDCFSHSHVQNVPMIAAIYEFHHDKWNDITWHASHYGAGLLVLMNVSLENIAIEIPVKAKEVLLPWYPNWNPLQVPAFKGITRRTCQILTTNLLSKSIDASVQGRVDKVVVSIVDPTLDNSYTAMAQRGGDGNIDELLQSNDRLIIFFTRPMHEERRVVNAQEIMNILSISLAPGYRLVVMQSIRPKSERIEDMHAIWQQYARIVVKAKVLMGAHGTALTNMIWAPDDCHLIEFNEFPDVNTWKDSHGEIPVRSMILAGFWMKTRTGDYWIIEASKKHPTNFYEGNLRVSIREVLQVFQQMRLLKPEVDIAAYPIEPHTVWEEHEREGFPKGK